METQSLFRTLMRRWWIFVLVFLVTMVAAVFLTLREAPVYKSKTTYITKLNTQIADTKTISSALDILNRQDDLLGTYSEVAMSTMIKRKAASKVGFTAGQQRNFTVSSKTVQGAKILEISVEGGDPEQVRAFTEAVGDETMQYANLLYAPYRLELLDPPVASSSPVSPNLPLNLVLGAVLGGFLGLSALLLSAWMRGELKSLPEAAIAEEAASLQPVKNELEALQKQFEQIHAELGATRVAIRETETEARFVYSILNNVPKNGDHQKSR